MNSNIKAPLPILFFLSMLLSGCYIYSDYNLVKKSDDDARDEFIGDYIVTTKEAMNIKCSVRETWGSFDIRKYENYFGTCASLSDFGIDLNVSLRGIKVRKIKGSNLYLAAVGDGIHVVLEKINGGVAIYVPLHAIGRGFIRMISLEFGVPINQESGFFKTNKPLTIDGQTDRIDEIILFLVRSGKMYRVDEGRINRIK